MSHTEDASSVPPRISRSIATLLGIPLDDPDVEPEDAPESRWSWKHGEAAWPFREPGVLSWDEVWSA